MTTPSTSRDIDDQDLDLSNSSRGVWLVKVPKYVANKWKKAPGDIEVGMLKIFPENGQQPQIQLSLSDAVMCLKEPGEDDIPKEYRLNNSNVTTQSLGVFSHVVSSNIDSAVPESEKLCMEGRVAQKMECRPYADPTYYKMKSESIRKASQPPRQVQQINSISVQTFKPVSDHKPNVCRPACQCNYQDEKEDEEWPPQ